MKSNYSRDCSIIMSLVLSWWISTLSFSVSLQYPQFEQSVMSSCPLRIQMTPNNTWEIIKLSFRTVLLPFFLPPTAGQPYCHSMWQHCSCQVASHRDYTNCSNYILVIWLQSATSWSLTIANLTRTIVFTDTVRVCHNLFRSTRRMVGAVWTKITVHGVYDVLPVNSK